MTGWMHYNLVAIPVLLALGISSAVPMTELLKASQTWLRNWGHCTVRGVGLPTSVTRETGTVQLSTQFPIKASMG